MPLLGEAARTSWPSWRRMVTVFEPIRPVPPITTIFIVSPPLSMKWIRKVGRTLLTKISGRRFALNTSMIPRGFPGRRRNSRFDERRGLKRPHGFPITIAIAAAKNGNGTETAQRNQTNFAGMNGISHKITRWNANSAQATT